MSISLISLGGFSRGGDFCLYREFLKFLGIGETYLISPFEGELSPSEFTPIGTVFSKHSPKLALKPILWGPLG
jgi:hypothetical protein